MDKVNHKIVGKLIIQLGERIASGECGLTDEEMVAVMSIALNKKMYIADLCRHYNISQRTLERWCNDGILPPLRHERGGKKYLLQSDVETFSNI